ncbi:MAG: sn-glycerol-3-phosphate ABC transporter ATP-binding protein UgpC [Pseudomonadota bacterium]
MASITLQAVEKWFDDNRVIKGVDLHIDDGQFVVFVGPSGCGKSTLLRMIAGLEDTSGGQILLDEDDVTDRAPGERGLSMVFQSYALYPHMSVRENIGFGLRTAGVASAEIADKVQSVSKILELSELLDRRPKALSGGQRQRVAIGRAIVREPKGFLFDEPLSNLDAGLRVQMRFEIAKLHEHLKTTMIYVTHDQVEAMTLADKIVVLRDGEIVQAGPPRELYETPNSEFVAQFIGSPKMNILPFEAGQTAITLDAEALPDATRSGSSSDGAAAIAKLGIRPEHITIGGGGPAHCNGRVEVVEYLGADSFVHVDCGEAGTIIVRADDLPAGIKGTTVPLTFAPTKLHFFTRSGQALR